MEKQDTCSAYNKIIEKIRKHLENYNFHECQTQILEPINHAKTQTEQKICFQPLNAHETSLCLRTTLDEQLANYALAQPQKAYSQNLFSIGPIFTPQQHNSASLTITPSTTILDAAWIIKILDSFLSEALLQETYTLKISYRGCQKDQEAKATRKTKHLCSTCHKDWQIMRETLEMLSTSFIEQPLWHAPTRRSSQLRFEYTIRSLDQINTLIHGERYMVENNEIAVAHVNIDALVELAQKINTQTSPPLHVIIPLNPAQNSLSYLIATILHHHGRCITVLPHITTTQSSLEQAHAMHPKYLLLLGQEEQEHGTITIKNLFTNGVETVKQTQLIEHLS